MYIAVVADNIAERKQTERLLGRANTALSGELGTLYINSYGDEDAFLKACMRYEMFIIDYGNDYAHSIAVAKKLKESTTTGLIAICKNEEDPFLHQFAEMDVFTLDKPLRTAPLHQLIREIHGKIEKKKANETILEIRGEVDTKYINKDEVMYVEFFEKEHKLLFHFKTEPDFEVIGTLDDLIKLLGDYSEFYMANKNTAVNSNHVISETKKGTQIAGGPLIKPPSIFEKLDRMLYRN